MSDKKFRLQVLASFGASSTVAKELYSYNKNKFEHVPHSKFEIGDELFMDAWNEYSKESIETGVFECLKKKLVQLNFPIKKGISLTENYRSATRKGNPVESIENATGLVLVCPDKLQLILYKSLAGRIPLIITGHREDFISILRALVMKNEPEPISNATGAMIIGGYNNWDRVRQHRKKWENKHNQADSEMAWKIEFSRLIPQKELYQDRFIILSDGPYSNVSARDMGLGEQEWKDISLAIRQEHEATHYFTKRIFSSMQNNLYDEILADYMGIVAAIGKFRADWFLRFMGLENFPDVHKAGRFFNYRGDPPLSDKAFKILQNIVVKAAKNLEQIDKTLFSNKRTLSDKSQMLVALTHISLEELASEKANMLLKNKIFAE